MPAKGVFTASVPANFEEFITRYPHYVEHVVCRFLRFSRTRQRVDVEDRVKSTLETEIEDYTQEVLAYLMTLPKDSKYRELGYVDRVQIYDPKTCPKGDSPLGHFKRFIKFMVVRFLVTYRTKQGRDALACLSNVSPNRGIDFGYESRLMGKRLQHECAYSYRRMNSTGRGWKSRLSGHLGIKNTYANIERIQKLVGARNR